VPDLRGRLSPKGVREPRSSYHVIVGLRVRPPSSLSILLAPTRTEDREHGWSAGRALEIPLLAPRDTAWKGGSLYARRYPGRSIGWDTRVLLTARIVNILCQVASGESKAVWFRFP
jgi:hypothetical protein